MAKKKTGPTPVPLGDGKFCYAGATCRLHNKPVGFKTDRNSLTLADTILAPGFVGEPSDKVIKSERYVTVSGEPEIDELGAVTLNVVTDTGQVENIRCGLIVGKGLIATEYISFVPGTQMEATVFTIERSYPNPTVYSFTTHEIVGCEITMPEEWFDELYVQQ